MKRCPSCDRAFEEDWLSFCTQDGTTLIEEGSTATEPAPTIAAAPSPSEPEILERGALNLRGSSPALTGWEAQEWQPPPPPLYAQPENKGLATAAMVVGISSIVCLGPIPGIVAIILGAVAISQINKAPERIGGKQFAWIGIATGSFTVLIYMVILIFYVILIGAAVSNGR